MKVPNPVLTAAAGALLGDPGTDANGSPLPVSLTGDPTRAPADPTVYAADMGVSCSTQQFQPAVDNVPVAAGCEPFGEDRPAVHTMTREYLDGCSATGPANVPLPLYCPHGSFVKGDDSDARKPDLSGERNVNDNAGNGDVDAAIRNHNERIKALRGNQETSVADRLRADTRPRPSVGRSVHFMPRHIEGNDKPGFLPAIITRVLDDETVNLRVFTDDGHDSVPHASNVPAGWSIRKTDDATQGYYWAWPERV